MGRGGRRCSAVAHQIYITFVAPPLHPRRLGCVLCSSSCIVCVQIPRNGRTKWSDINWRVIVDRLCNGNGLSCLRTQSTQSPHSDWITSLGWRRRVNEGENLRRLQCNKYSQTRSIKICANKRTSMYPLLCGRPPNRIRAAAKRLPQFLYHSLRRNGKLRVA